MLPEERLFGIAIHNSIGNIRLVITNSVFVWQPKRTTLLVSYNSKALQEICYQHALAVNLLGEDAALSLQARHADLQAANTVLELPIGELEMHGIYCTLKFRDILTILMAPNYGTAEAYDWSTVRRIKLLGVNDVE